MTVEGRSPERKASIAATISSGLRSRIRGTGVFTVALVGWQPKQEVAPGGGPAASAPAEKTKGSTRAPTRLAAATGDPITLA
jgi:hypothetical protein